jgi:large subunit ribosomal protein L4
VVATTLDALQASKKALVVDDRSNGNLILSIRNLRDHHFLPPEGLNVYDLLRHQHLVVTKNAVKTIEQRCLRGRRDDEGTEPQAS